MQSVTSIVAVIYGSVYMYKDLSKIHLLFEDDFIRMDYSTSTEYNGNAVVAPAQSIEDVSDIWDTYFIQAKACCE